MTKTPHWMTVCVALCALISAAIPSAAQTPATQRGPRPGGLVVERNLVYSGAGDTALALDLYRRAWADQRKSPVVLWIHDGDLASGSKEPTPAAMLVAAGYSVASIEYRRAGQHASLASLGDAKAAVRWLRANGGQHGIATDKIGVWGMSQGGQLAALLGTSGDVAALDGESTTRESSRVQAVVDYAGDALGGTEPRSRDRTADAPTALQFASGDDPPFLIVHGTADRTVPPDVSRQLQLALKRVGVANDLKYVPGARHRFDELHTPAVAEAVTSFFDKHLRGGERLRDDVEDINQPADAWIDAFAAELPATRYKLFPTPSRGPDAKASYRIYLPPGYDLPANSQQRYPVIYYLHGLNEDSGKAVNSGYVERLDLAVRAGAMPPAIVVVVQGLNASFYVDSGDGKAPVERVFIRDLIPHVDRTYRTVATRAGRAIEGHSMGGAGALHMAFKYPDMFASVSAFAAALLPAELTESPAALQRQADMFYGGDLMRMEAEGAWSLVARNIDKIRGKMFVRLICGENDRLMKANLWMSSLLDKHEVRHEFVVSKGAPHSVKEVIARLDESPFPYYAKVFRGRAPPASSETPRGAPGN